MFTSVRIVSDAMVPRLLETPWKTLGNLLETPWKQLIIKITKNAHKLCEFVNVYLKEINIRVRAVSIKSIATWDDNSFPMRNYVKKASTFCSNEKHIF